MMSTRFVAAFGVACFTIGALVQAGVAQGKKPVFSPEMLTKEPMAAATELLDGALQLAENGSWEPPEASHTPCPPPKLRNAAWWRFSSVPVQS